jgi:hypothetical protein
MPEHITALFDLLDERDFPLRCTGAPAHGATRVALGIGGDTHALTASRGSGEQALAGMRPVMKASLRSVNGCLLHVPGNRLLCAQARKEFQQHTQDESARGCAEHFWIEPAFAQIKSNEPADFQVMRHAVRSLVVCSRGRLERIQNTLKVGLAKAPRGCFEVFNAMRCQRLST